MDDQKEPGPTLGGLCSLLLETAVVAEDVPASSHVRPSRQARTASWKLALDSSSSKAPSKRFLGPSPPQPTPPPGDLRLACSVFPKLTRFWVRFAEGAACAGAGAGAGAGRMSARRFLSFSAWPVAMPISRMWHSSISCTASIQSKPCSIKRPTYRSKPMPARKASTSAISLFCSDIAAWRFAAAPVGGGPAFAVEPVADSIVSKLLRGASCATPLRAEPPALPGLLPGALPGALPPSGPLRLCCLGSARLLPREGLSKTSLT
mmetsp:Transcript_57534/g.108425  ORF Transcript_57534/g.108425 Transcript_57534/m.108425 type:complete len:263 (-) Transcript_57534:295-1083(-)